MNESNWTESLVKTLSSFSVTVPSQNDYNLAKISLGTSKITLHETVKISNFLKIVLFWKTRFEKVNLVWHLSPIR